MKPFQSILIGADFSEGSREAFRAACSLATPGRTQLHVLHVIEPHWVPEEPVPFGQAALECYDANVGGAGDADIKQRMETIYAPDTPIDVDYRLSRGEASAEILRIAEEIRPDLLAVGTHGRTGLSWLLAGSVATSVLRNARCPVLALHCPETPRAAEEIRTILHPTDFSKCGESGLRVARSLARDLGARLILFHAVPFGIYGSEMTMPVDPGVYRDALNEQRRLADGADMKYPVEARLGRGEPGEEILRAAAELDSGLIVMGTHGRTGLGRLLLGSVTEYVMTRAACPVLAVKASSAHEVEAPNTRPAPAAAIS